MPDDVRDLFDTSRIRDDTGHWDARAAHVAARAVRASRREGLEWLSNSRGALVAASLFVTMALLSVVSSGESPSARHPDAELTKALAPADDVARAIILGDAPPLIETLLLDERGGA